MSKIDEMTLGELRELLALLAPRANAGSAVGSSPLLGKHVLVRTFSAGVHIGTLVAKDGENVLLQDARRIWKWEGAFTLSEVSQKGVKKQGSRIAMTVPWMELTNANELLPTSEEARKTFEVCHE